MSDYDRWLRACEESEELLPEDRVDLRKLLEMKVFRKVIALNLQELQGQLMQFRALNFLSPEGQAKATQIQGRLEGQQRFLELLWAEAHQEETTNG